MKKRMTVTQRMTCKRHKKDSNRKKTNDMKTTQRQQQQNTHNRMRVDVVEQRDGPRLDQLHQHLRRDGQHLRAARYASHAQPTPTTVQVDGCLLVVQTAVDEQRRAVAVLLPLSAARDDIHSPPPRRRAAPPAAPPPSPSCGAPPPPSPSR